jgi:hypothetical protein
LGEAGLELAQLDVQGDEAVPENDLPEIRATTERSLNDEREEPPPDRKRTTRL